MKHVYLSPHLDDAVLSCGGAIHRQAQAGDEVLVVTLITGDVAPGAPLSPFAQRLHADWGNHPRPFRLRRAEDLVALECLGAQARHLGYLDAIYRQAPAGGWMYVDGPALFGSVHPGDTLPAQLGSSMEQWLDLAQPAGTVYAPLGVGRHVDHQVVHALARAASAAGRQVAFYEDYPYADGPGAPEAAIEAAGAQAWRVEDVPLDPADVAAKVAALGYYRSQLGILFGGGEAMIQRVWAFAARSARGAGLAERIWWP